jgi:hypothetical protein
VGDERATSPARRRPPAGGAPARGRPAGADGVLRRAVLPGGRERRVLLLVPGRESAVGDGEWDPRLRARAGLCRPVLRERGELRGGRAGPPCPELLRLRHGEPPPSPDGRRGPTPGWRRAASGEASWTPTATSSSACSRCKPTC